MKAPDKIYTNNRGVYAELPIFSQIDANIEYIRKEALLEWAKQKQYDSYTIVQDNFWQEVIDKLNSM